MYDVLIIGGGIVGVSIAHELARFQLKIVLLEKEAELAFGVSKSNSGIIHTGFQADHATLKAKLAVRGNQLYAQLAKNLDFPFKRVGELIVAFPGQEAALQAIYENGRKLKIRGMQVVDAAWLRKNEPNLSKQVSMALLGGTAGIINPYEAIYALAEQVGKNGVQINCAEEVWALGQKKRLWQVRTSKATYAAKYIINAAGLSADEVAQMAKVVLPRIQPRKGEEFLLDKHAGKLTERIIFPLPSKKSKGILVTPMIDGNYMLGPTAQDVVGKTDLSTTLAGKNAVVKQARRLVPRIKGSAIIAGFAGLRPTLASEDFYIQEDKPGLINLLGIQSPGLTAAPAIAEYVREIIGVNMILKPNKKYQVHRKGISRFRALSPAQQKQAIKANADFGEIVCRCEQVTRGEIIEAIRRGALTLDGIKFRTRSQMGRCHGAFCTAKIMEILHQELGLSYDQISKRGSGSEVVRCVL